MNKTEFVAALADKLKVPRTEAAKYVEVMLETITETLKAGDKLTLTGFGTFEVRQRAAREGRNIRTGEKIHIAASKLPAFSAGAVLKETVGGPAKKPAAKK